MSKALTLRIWEATATDKATCTCGLCPNPNEADVAYAVEDLSNGVPDDTFAYACRAHVGDLLGNLVKAETSLD